jgi:hypothetical protein
MSHEHPLKRLEHFLTRDPIPGHAGEPDRRSEPMADRAEPHADRAAMLGTLISVSGSQGVVHSALPRSPTTRRMSLSAAISASAPAIRWWSACCAKSTSIAPTTARRRPAASTCWARSSPTVPAVSASAAACRSIPKLAAIPIGEAELRLIFDAGAGSAPALSYCQARLSTTVS